MQKYKLAALLFILTIMMANVSSSKYVSSGYTQAINAAVSNYVTTQSFRDAVYSLLLFVAPSCSATSLKYPSNPFSNSTTQLTMCYQLENAYPW